MRRTLKLLCHCLIIVSVISCSNNQRKQQVAATISNGELLATSLAYVLKQKSLPVEYYNQPLQIVKSSKYRIISRLRVNGIDCVLLPEDTNVGLVLKHADVFKPIPLVEVGDLKIIDDLIDIEIILRATGHNFKLKLKTDKNKNYRILELKEATI